MADHDLWRKNIPEDFQGKMGDNWDDEVDINVVYWGTAGIAFSVAFAFVLCWYLMKGPLDYIPQKYWGAETKLSPLAEAQERRLPPTPWLQPKPEVELDAMLEEMAEHNSGYGWNDQLNGIVHIPVDRAMDLVAASFDAAPSAAVEPGQEEPMDVETPTTDSHGDGEADAGDEHEAAEGEAHG